jgi:hypothetical protein
MSQHIGGCMSNKTMSDELARSISRRSIVRTGTKLAYAAPIVAATTKLTGRGAMAISVGVGGPDPICNGEDACLPTPTCGQAGSNCSCSTLVAGGGLCRPTVGDCGSPVPCNSNADCEAADSSRPYCVVVDNCCKPATHAGICTARCATP